MYKTIKTNKKSVKSFHFSFKSQPIQQIVYQFNCLVINRLIPGLVIVYQFKC